MESDEDDPFCYRSLKKRKTNQEKADQHNIRADHVFVKSKTKTSKAERNPKRKSNRKSAELSSNKITENGSESENPKRPELESEVTDVHSSTNKKTMGRVTKANHTDKSVQKTTVEVQCLRELVKRTKEHQHKPDTSETILGESVSDHVLQKSSSATPKPTEKHCQKNGTDYSNSGTSSFQNNESYITTISDVCLKLDAKQDIQTEPNVSKETSQTSDLPEGKNGVAASKVKEQMATVFEEGRCPFCQMPFRALSGQSPNWHTMECMDMPLKTTQECPAGLTCDSTVPSHYRRYGHSQMALHLAGQGQQDGCAGPGGRQSQGLGGHSSANLETVSPLRAKLDGTAATTSASPQQKQQSQTKSKSRKQSSSKSKHEGSASGLSLSQGSQGSTGSNSSIKAYFSPSGKKPTSCANDACSQNCGDGGSEIKSDRVPRLLILSDSDSNESVDNNDDRFQNETEEDEMDAGIGNGSHQYDCKHPTEALHELGSPVVEDLGDGFILQEPDDQEAFPDSRDVVVTHAENTVHSATETKTQESLQVLADNETEGQSGLHISHFTSTTVARTSLAPTGLQKQTSLFSFFKPHCHSANVSKHGAPKGPTAVSPKPSGSERRNKRSSVQTGRKPPLIKSTSEPVTMMRVPSPPPSTVGRTNTKRQTSQGGRASGSASSSFRNSSGRQCPFYKRLPGTSITVDAFNYGEIQGCQAYVLTHFHYDHYQGLTKKFSQPIYCSQVTGNLVQRQLGVSTHLIHTLPLNQPCQVAGVCLTLMEANHCPGAVIILFELPNGRKLLHTGDFRADPCMEQYPPLLGVSVDELYLDTTYCDPAHAFPSQGEAIQFAVSTALKAVEREPRTLIVCGAYTIGKERIFIAIAEALQTKVCVQSAKKRVLDCLEDERLKKMLSLKWTEGSVHVLPMRQLNAKGLSEHLRQCCHFSSVLAFEPTGWTHSNKTLSLDHLRPKFSSTGITVYGVPYSEHSSYLEMKRFVQFVRPKKILPTVNNGNPASRKKMEAIFRQWLSEGTSPGKQASANSTTQPSLSAWLGKPS